MAVFIKQRKLKNKTTENIPQIVKFGFVSWNFIYKSEWDKLTAHKDNSFFKQYIALQFKSKTLKFLSKNKRESVKSNKQVNVSRISSPISSRLSKIVLEKSKFYKFKMTFFSSSSNSLSSHSRCLYTQISKNNIKNIVKIKKTFSNLSAKKIEDVHKVLNNNKKKKLKINMMTKCSSGKQIIIPISSTNSYRFMALSNKYITNINRALKNIKSKVVVDFI